LFKRKERLSPLLEQQLFLSLNHLFGGKSSGQENLARTQVKTQNCEIERVSDMCKRERELEIEGERERKREREKEREREIVFQESEKCQKKVKKDGPQKNCSFTAEEVKAAKFLKN